MKTKAYLYEEKDQRSHKLTSREKSMARQSNQPTKKTGALRKASRRNNHEGDLDV